MRIIGAVVIVALAAANVVFAVDNAVEGNAGLAGINVGVGVFCFCYFLFLLVYRGN